MKRMKKFLLYFLLFIGLYIFVELIINLGLQGNRKKVISYEIKNTSLPINITECSASKFSGNIKGTITNNTEQMMQNKRINFNFYNDNGTYLGTKTQVINYFNVQEKVNFDITAKCENINKIEIELVDNLKQEDDKEEDKSLALINPQIDESTIKIALPIAAVMSTLYMMTIFGL